MRQTLFWIPYEVGGVPLFGFGLLLALWLIGGVGLLVYLVRKQGWNSETLGYLPMLLIVAAAIVGLPRLFPDALPIRGYGFMLLLAVSSGVGLAAYRARRMGVNPELIFSMAFWLFVFGIVGARLFHVIEYWHEDYRQETAAATLQAILNIPQGGLVFYGSLIGGLIGFALFIRRNKLPLLAFADLIAPSVMLGLALGRVGCLLNGCCYGGACELPWAVTFPADSPPYEAQVYDGTLVGLNLGEGEQGLPVVTRVAPNSPAEAAGLTVGDQVEQINGFAVDSPQRALTMLGQLARQNAPAQIETSAGRAVELAAPPLPARSAPVHPTQVYSTINAALLCLFLLAYYPYRRRDGEVAALMLTLYPLMRFLVEIIRIDESAVFQTGLSISQNVSLVILLAIIGGWIYVFRQPRGSAFPPPAPAETGKRKAALA